MKLMRAPTILHCFGEYLPTTQNWAFRLISNIPGCRQLVASHDFLDNAFFTADVEYLRPPISIPQERTVGRRLHATLVKIATRIYPIYLRHRLMHRRIDVLHSHFANIGWRYRRLADRLGAIHVVSFYGWDYEYLPTVHPEWKALIQRLFNEADVLLCEGPHGASVLSRLGCSEDKIRVCRLGVEPTKIPVHHRTKSPGELSLLQVASLREKKGHAHTIRAFIAAAEACPGATLTLVGSGDRAILNDLESCIAAAQLQDRIFLWPEIDFSTLHEFMRQFHVFIHPSIRSSLNDCEGGAPIVLLDAQATGMPVISTRHCDIPEEVTDGRTGILVDEGDLRGLSDAISRFYSMSQSEYDEFSSRARTHVVSNFASAECSAHLAEIYSEALDRSTKTPRPAG